MRPLTKSAASGPFAALKLMSKLMPDSMSSNLIIGTFALAMICTPAQELLISKNEAQSKASNTLESQAKHGTAVGCKEPRHSSLLRKLAETGRDEDADLDVLRHVLSDQAVGHGLER